MERKNILWCLVAQVVLILTICFHPIQADAATLNVPSGYPNIQFAIDAAVDGDTVLIADGVYSGEGNYNVDFKGKAIVLKSQNGPLNCIIDPQQQGRGILFQNNESPETKLDGFTIRNARADIFAVATVNGGGIYCEDASPTISNCIIKNCYSTGNGAGIYFHDSSSSVSNCVISDNSSDKYGWGGGIASSGSKYGYKINLLNCTIVRNNSVGPGGGISFRLTSLNIKNCLINENIGQNGGGMYASQSSLLMTNCIVANNISTGDALKGWGYGGGLYLDGGTLTNCTIYGNSSSSSGGGIYFNDYGSSQPIITNSIIWGNTTDEISIREDVPLLIPVFKFCNIEGGYNGEGNFHGDPLFINSESNDFHLSVQSPCIDRGTSEGSPEIDIEGNQRPQGVGIDVGAYELTGYASTRPKIESFAITPHSVSFPVLVSFICTATDLDGEIISYTIDYGDGSPIETNTTGLFEHTYYSTDVYATCTVTDNSGITVNSISLSPLYNGVINVPSDYTTIQEAVDAAADKSNTTILVADGIYRGEGNRNIDFKGKAITVKSQNGPDNTIIDCERAGRGFIFNNKEGSDSILSGFTVLYGIPLGLPDLLYSFGGGGIFCSSSPVIENCIIKYNESGGIYIRNGSALIENCTITENKSGNGGGIYLLEGTPTISKCVISKNIALAQGLEPTVAGGGGIFCHNNTVAPKIVNCIIANNVTVGSGGGIHGGAYTALNCTLSGNISLSGIGGGIKHYSSSSGPEYEPIFTNCILWGNWPNEIYNLSSDYSSPRIFYSNIQGGYTGEGNISQNPLFTDPAGDNFTLEHNSPCIDTGTSSVALDNDINGATRPLNTGYDMGAFEATVYDSSQPIIDTFNADVTEGDRPLEVTFSCTAHDVDGTISSYFINYGDGSDIETNTTGIFSHTYNSGGRSYAVCTVSDNNGKEAHSKSTLIRRAIHVPDDYPSIQAATHAAYDGDTVIVSDGVYTGEMNKNILYFGKAITVRSENGPENTIVDCEQEGIGFIFSNYEDADSVLTGFKIINGYNERGGEYAAGIQIDESGPTITNCIIQGNNGRGISIMPFSWPIITDSIISENSGGGIFCSHVSEASIINCKIIDNYIETIEADVTGRGGGMHVAGNTYTTIINCIISGNSVENGYGGGIYAEDYLVMVNSIISKNSAYNGGGIYFDTLSSDDGYIDENGNSDFIQNCTITQNIASEGAGIYTNLDMPISVINSIIWNNSPDEIKNYSNKNISIAFSNIKGGYAGNGNINFDPLFIDPANGNFKLDINSKCIDTGLFSNAPEFIIDFDIIGVQRPIGYGYDMGVFESIDFPANPPSLELLNLFGLEQGNKWKYGGIYQDRIVSIEKEITYIDQNTFSIPTYVLERKGVDSVIKKEWLQDAGNQVYLWGTTIENDGNYYDLRFSEGLRYLCFPMDLYDRANSSATTEILGSEFNVSLKIDFIEKTTIDLLFKTYEAYKVYYYLHIWGTSTDLTLDIEESNYRWFVPNLGFVKQQSSEDDTVELKSSILDNGNYIYPVDTDGDGLPDSWEEFFGLNPLVNDADDDTDGDGQSNFEEYLKGTNPDDLSDYRISPVADAGEDQIDIFEGETVTLFGSNSSDPDDGIASYFWEQIDEDPEVTLSDDTDALPTFVTPPVGEEGITLSFKLTVTDNVGLASEDTVLVTVNDNGITGFPEYVTTFTTSTNEDTGFAMVEGGDVVALDIIAPSMITDTRNRPENLIYGLMDFTFQTDVTGGTVNVTIYLPTPAPQGYKWYKYSSTDGWIDYSSHASFNVERDQITLTLTDGGTGDNDGVANGIILDPSGLGSTPVEPDDPADPPVTDDPPSTDGEGGGGGGGSGIFGNIALSELTGYHLDWTERDGTAVYMPITDWIKALKGAQTHVEGFAPDLANFIRGRFDALERKAKSDQDGFLSKTGTYLFPVFGRIAEMYLDVVDSHELMDKAYADTTISVDDFNNLTKQGTAVSSHVIKEESN